MLGLVVSFVLVSSVIAVASSALTRRRSAINEQQVQTVVHRDQLLNGLIKSALVSSLDRCRCLMTPHLTQIDSLTKLIKHLPLQGALFVGCWNPSVLPCI